MLISANLYPWDVDGDPAAVDRIAGLGLSRVTLAAAYHAVRAVTPFHPGHRIVTRDAAVYYRAAAARWGDSPLRPAVADPPGSFERAAARLRAAGLRVSAWAVLSHNAWLGTVAPSGCLQNAYGDRYPWALCIASPQVRDYLRALAAEVAALGGADEIELEACGWYGFDHASAHDKTAGPAIGAGTGPAAGGGIGGGAGGGTGGGAGAAASAAAQWLLSLCFCPACGAAYAEAGADPARLRALVCSALDRALGWGSAPAGMPSPLSGEAGPNSGEAGWPATEAGVPSTEVGVLSTEAAVLSAEGMLSGEAASCLLRVRAALAAQLLREVIAAVRAAAPGKPVLVHSDPDPRATGANPGYEPGLLLGRGGADGVVLACWDPASAGPRVARTAAAAPPGARIAASLLAVSGLGGRPEALGQQAAAVRRAGATELRLYHAGLASASDLAAIRSFCDTQ